MNGETSAGREKINSTTEVEIELSLRAQLVYVWMEIIRRKCRGICCAGKE